MRQNSEAVTIGLLLDFCFSATHKPWSDKWSCCSCSGRYTTSSFQTLGQFLLSRRWGLHFLLLVVLEAWWLLQDNAVCVWFLCLLFLAFSCLWCSGLMLVLDFFWEEQICLFLFNPVQSLDAVTRRIVESREIQPVKLQVCCRKQLCVINEEFIFCCCLCFVNG